MGCRLQTKLFITVALIVAVVLCPANAHAQQTASAAENKQAADTALREKAFELLDSLAGQVSTLQSAENRARIGSNIAASIWPHDEKRARDLFAAIAEDIKAGLEPPQGYDYESTHTFLVFLTLRSDTIERIAKYDPELAYAFFKATQFSPTPQRRIDLLNREHELEMQLANQVARSRPDLALELARKSLSRGFSRELRELLSQMNRKNKDQALVLYKEIVQKLGQADLAKNWSARSFALNLVVTFSPPAADESSFRELAGLLSRTAIANGCSRRAFRPDEPEGLCSMVGNALPYIAKVDPASAAQLKQWENQIPYSDGPLPPYAELQDLVADGTVEEIVALASQYPKSEEYIFRSAIQMVRDSGDFERARKIASSFPGNSEKRKAILAQLDADLSRASIKEEELAEALKSLVEITRPRDQVLFLVILATKAGVSDPKMALKLLNQASEIVDAMKPGNEQTEGQMRLAMMYCMEKSDRGLAIMESVVPKLNGLVDAAARLDGYDMRYLRDGEWNMTGEGSLGRLLTALAQNAGYFAWCDFDRAVRLTGQFERAEIRMMAQLKLAQGILAGPPKRPQMVYQPRR